MNSYGMDERDRGFCEVCNWADAHCVCVKLRTCRKCKFSLTGTAQQFLKHSCQEQIIANTRKIIELYFRPWGAAKAAEWEEIAGDGVFSAERALEVIRNILAEPV